MLRTYLLHSTSLTSALAYGCARFVIVDMILPEYGYGLVYGFARCPVVIVVVGTVGKMMVRCMQEHDY